MSISLYLHGSPTTPAAPGEFRGVFKGLATFLFASDLRKNRHHLPKYKEVQKIWVLLPDGGEFHGGETWWPCFLGSIHNASLEAERRCWAWFTMMEFLQGGAPVRER